MSAVRCSPPLSPHTFHHSRPLATVRFGLVTQHHALTTPVCSGICDYSTDHYTDLWDLAYGWLEEHFGFWPLFLAVGSDAYALQATGYSDQWRRITSWAKAGNTYRAKGTYPSDVLFSYASAPPLARYSDHNDYTGIVLNAIDHDGSSHYLRPISNYLRRLVLKPSWTPARWLAAARSNRLTVQACVPALDLSLADAVWCRSASVRTRLLTMGFAPSQVSVVRLPVSTPWYK